MSKPPAGTYYIVSRVNSPSGDKLAITFNGQGNTATVTPLLPLTNLNGSFGTDAQKWNIVDYADGRNQSFSPITAPSLQANIVSGAIVVVPAYNYVYFARVGPSGLSIQGGNGSVQSWTLNPAAVDAQVKFADGLGSEKSFWVLVPV